MRIIAALILCLHLAAPAWAQVASQRDPFSYPIKQWALILGIALFGGLASWWLKVRRGEIGAHSLGYLIGELTIAAFTGVITFFVCEYLALHPMLTAAVVGLSGHMGARAIALLEKFVEKRITRHLETRPGDLEL